ncbi:hypothetical protein AX16_002650 [Volvariella volvacea WC 439]|nr:hypothetical protein AX16_002650 [Volvariella volvacea WC 439]
MLPVVKLHDIATRDLVYRIGGSKTGLLNASMSNVVSTVVAISALRKCELRVVQSSLIGSMLSKLLLVLGLCFFAGGMRFTEQGFDVTATQIHSSLLSISVGAVLLPAAYHFALSGASGSVSPSQQHSILQMSHSVSLVLLFIYAAYLLFQLWSHTHLYKDSTQQSCKLVVKVPDTPKIFRSTKKMKVPCNDGPQVGEKQFFDSPSPSASFLPEKPAPFYASIPRDSASCSSEIPLVTDIYSVKASPDFPSEGPTIRLVGTQGNISVSSSQDTFRASTRCSSPPAMSVPTKAEDTRMPCLVESSSPSLIVPAPSLSLPSHSKKAPRIGWPVTILSMVILTVCVSVLADWLVATMDGISHAIGKEWVSLILLPTVNALAECTTAVTISVKDQMTLSIGVTIGSTIQTALFVIPFMVTLAWTMGHPLSLLMDPFESLVLYIAVQTMSYVVAGGKSNWLEGLILICLYIIIAVSFWFYPESELPEALAVC